MRICLVKEGRAFEGESLVEIVKCVSGFSVDYRKGEVFIPYKNIGQDTVSYSVDFTPVEMERLAANRVLSILERDGWTFYRKSR